MLYQFHDCSLEKNMFHVQIRNAGLGFVFYSAFTIKLDCMMILNFLWNECSAFQQNGLWKSYAFTNCSHEGSNYVFFSSADRKKKSLVA